MARTDKKVGYLPPGRVQDWTPSSAAHGVEAALKILEGRWKLVILFHLFGGIYLSWIINQSFRDGFNKSLHGGIPLLM